MHVIRLDVQFEHFDLFFLFAQLVYLPLRVFTDLVREDSIAILGTEHQMILAFIQGV